MPQRNILKINNLSFRTIPLDESCQMQASDDKPMYLMQTFDKTSPNSTKCNPYLINSPNETVPDKPIPQTW